jgi:6-phosphofructokinase 2
VPDIVTITINPTVDIFVNVDLVEPTLKLRCSAPKRDPGGGGINVARVAYRLGGDVTAIYPIGGAIGKLLQRLLDREGIDSIVTPSHVETRENFTAYEAESGRQFRFVLPGSILHRAEWEACLGRLELLPSRPKFVVASGSVPPGVPDDFFARVVREAKRQGAQTVVDTSGAALTAVLDEGITLFKPNLLELGQLVGKTLEDDAACVAACRDLIISGRTRAVALTLGDKGALLVTAERAWKAQSLEIDVASTVGAGDSFLGGMVAALAAGEPIEDAFRAGVAAGSAAAMSPGTELCRPEDVARLLPQVTIDEVAAAAV